MNRPNPQLSFKVAFSLGFRFICCIICSYTLHRADAIWPLARNAIRISSFDVVIANLVTFLPLWVHLQLCNCSHLLVAAASPRFSLRNCSQKQAFTVRPFVTGRVCHTRLPILPPPPGQRQKRFLVPNIQIMAVQELHTYDKFSEMVGDADGC